MSDSKSIENTDDSFPGSVEPVGGLVKSESSECGSKPDCADAPASEIARPDLKPLKAESIDTKSVANEFLSNSATVREDSKTELSKSAKTHCLNCDRLLFPSDRFCGNCGQKVADLQVTLWFLVSDFLAQQFAVEGKLFRSLSALMTRPGKLTIDFCNGRRARYFSPIQIYLLTGVIFFLMIDVFSNFDSLSAVQVDSGGLEKAFEYEGTKSITLGIKSAELTALQFNEFVATSPNELPKFFSKNDIEMGALEMFFARGSHQLLQPGGLKAFVTTYVSVFSQSILLMMPVFGFLFYGLYWRKSEGLVQAVVFSAHVHAFNYIMLVVISIVSLILDIAWLRSVLFIVNFGYLAIASRKVFGGGYLAAAIKSMIALFVYFFAVSIFVILLLPIVFLAM